MLAIVLGHVGVPHELPPPATSDSARFPTRRPGRVGPADTGAAAYVLMQLRRCHTVSFTNLALPCSTAAPANATHKPPLPNANPPAPPCAHHLILRTDRPPKLGVAAVGPAIPAKAIPALRMARLPAEDAGPAADTTTQGRNT
ncbi:hypothetical protein GCM10022214_05660 [Actinomadura miaoliensis]|uniref:Uncharacterized protein n=1 Tax=Actinomadura miaoliensis TaxID=430685 RepID=A0ABP7V0J9_9ACTN